MGRGTQLPELDLASAFLHILVHPDDWKLLGSTWHDITDDSNLAKSFYVSIVLPFDLTSSPKLFTDFAHATTLITVTNGASYINH